MSPVGFNYSPITDHTLNNIPVDDETIVGYTPDGQPIYQKKATLGDLAKQQGKNELLDQGKAALRNTFAGDSTTSASSGAAPEVMGSPFNSTLSGASSAPASGWSLSGAGSAGNFVLPAAGAAGLYDLSQNRKRIGTGAGYLEAGASGAAMGSYFGPYGAAAGFALGVGANAFGIGGQSRTKGEEDERQALADQGVNIPNSGVKEWELNPVFQKSRNESDLTGKDIVHAGDFYAIKGYSDLDPTKQEAITSEALKEGLIQEKEGKINLSMTPQYQAYLNSQLSAPAPSSGGDGGGGGNQVMAQVQAEAKKQKKQAALSSILSKPIAAPPNYQTNPGTLITNPYLQELYG